MIAVFAAATVALGAWSCLLAAYRQRFARTYPPARSLAFVAGTGVLALTLGSPLERFADTSFGWHMAQHMLLLMLVPPLVLLAQPLELVLAVAPAALARRLVRALRTPPLAWLGHPFVGFFGLIAVMWVAHFSALFEAAAENELIHAGEHLLFLAGAFFFWAPVTGTTPFPTPLAYPVRMFYLFIAMPPSAFLGFALYEMRVSPYAHYPSILDLHNGGELMWIVGGASMFVALMIVGFQWARREERYALDAGGA